MLGFIKRYFEKRKADLMIAARAAATDQVNNVIKARMEDILNDCKKVAREQVPDIVDTYLSTNEGLIIVYTLVSLRGDFLYFVANNYAEKPPGMDYYYTNERTMLEERLLKAFKNKSKEQIAELVAPFYEGK